MDVNQPYLFCIKQPYWCFKLLSHVVTKASLRNWKLLHTASARGRFHKIIVIRGRVGNGCWILRGAEKAEIVLEVIVARQTRGRCATSSDAARLSVAVSHSLLGQPGRVLQSLLSRGIRSRALATCIQTNQPTKTLHCACLFRFKLYRYNSWMRKLTNRWYFWWTSTNGHRRCRPNDEAVKHQGCQAV